MSDINYRQLRVLIADDFSNFRSTMGAMFAKLGVDNIQYAATGEEVIQACKRENFDLVLCDYDLGMGKNGQHVLEELRFSQSISRCSLFIIVSADAAKDVVMAAYDCEPDDYLMKPITAKMLHKRITRLLLQRKTLTPVYKAIEKGQKDFAINQLIDLSLTENRYALAAQKLLGELFIEAGELAKAEKLYSRALESRSVDWARLGLAKVKQLKGELETSGDWLEKIINDNPLYLPAYDVLASHWQQSGDGQELQNTIARSISISPKSILRQKRLAQVAEDNGDFPTALDALRATVRLGELSCHASAEDNLNFARVAAGNIERQLVAAEPLSNEAIDVVAVARERFSLTPDQQSRADLLEGRVQALAGNLEVGRELIEEVNRALESVESLLEVDLERISAFQTLNELDRADALVKLLLQKYANNQAALEKIDKFLSEPVSDSNREMVADVNRSGIDLYNQERFDEAIACFEKARKIFPKHVGIQLNIVQTLVGKMRAGIKDGRTFELTRESLSLIDELIEPGHSQYERFMKLQDMAAASMST